MGDLNWTDDQWRKVKDAVTEAFGKASVASAFLPLYGPLSPGAEMVRNERLTFDDSVSPPVVLNSKKHNASPRNRSGRWELHNDSHCRQFRLDIDD